jgi:hypothetical protein
VAWVQARVGGRRRLGPQYRQAVGTAIHRNLAEQNDGPEPFVWTKPGKTTFSPS